MPATQSLQWVDISDFTAGLWDPSASYNKFATPTNAFTKLDDYQPMKGGGLRPWYAAMAVSLAGVGASEEIIGVFARNGMIRTGAGGTGNVSTDVLIVTMKSADKKFRIYRLDGSVGAPAWSLRFTSAANNDDSHKPVGFAYFLDTNGVEWYLMSIQSNGSGANLRGLYKMQVDLTVASNTGNDGAVTNINGDYGPLCVSQARIIVGVGDSASVDYSDVGLTTFSGSTHGTLKVSPDKGEAQVTSINSVEPSDLLLGKSGAPWVEINGDITSAPVREMGDDHHARQSKQQCPKTPGGICFIEPGGRVFETDGRNFKVLTSQIGGRTLSWSNNMSASGTMAYHNGYLLIPGTNSVATGVVYDFETGALFRTTGINPVFSYTDAYGGIIYSANHDPASQSLVTYDMFAGSRVTTGVIQTVPFADKNGRNIDVREVQLYALTSATTEFKVELVDENDASVVTRYLTVTGAKRDVLRAQFPATKSGYLSVRITPRTLDGSSEGPTFERLRIGFGINNLIAGVA